MSWDRWHRDPREGEAPDLDHAEWQNGPEDEYLVEDARGRELGAAEMAAEVHRIFDRVLARIERERQTGAKS